MFERYLALLLVTLSLSGCAMSEEMRRIEGVKLAQRQRELAHSGNLTGEQLFIRSCNTCHPGGKAGMGPSLESVNQHFPDDAALKKFIRTGKGIMPGQPAATMNEDEVAALILYVRNLHD
jgi:cytochrome c2